MDFFSKMMQTFSSILLPKEINDDELFSQITAALQEERFVWNTQNDFIEPDVIENFQNKWSSAYYTAKKAWRKAICALPIQRNISGSRSLILWLAITETMDWAGSVSFLRRCGRRSMIITVSCGT